MGDVMSADTSETRRRALEALIDARHQGGTLAQAAEVLGMPEPTLRAWASTAQIMRYCPEILSTVRMSGRRAPGTPREASAQTVTVVAIAEELSRTGDTDAARRAAADADDPPAVFRRALIRSYEAGGAYREIVTRALRSRGHLSNVVRTTCLPAPYIHRITVSDSCWQCGSPSRLSDLTEYRQSMLCRACLCSDDPDALEDTLAMMANDRRSALEDSL